MPALTPTVSSVAVTLDVATTDSEAAVICAPPDTVASTAPSTVSLVNTAPAPTAPTATWPVVSLKVRLASAWTVIAPAFCTEPNPALTAP